MAFFRSLGRRLIFLVPQLFGVIVVSFFLVKSIPGDPAVLMLGAGATPEAIEGLREKLGLTKPIFIQFYHFVVQLAHGDLGTSWQTTKPVLDDLLERFPATIELISFSLVLAMLIGIPLGVVAAVRPKSWAARVADMYGLGAGAIPDFWLALVLIFIFYTVLQIVPAPLGRIDMAVLPPPTITGLLTVDSILTGNWAAFSSALAHLVLPVAALGLVNAGPILKMTASSMQRMLASDFSNYSVLCGIPEGVVAKRALRNALPSIVTIISVLYGYLIGGAVLVEIVFSWGGAGQYAVQGVLNSDIYPVIGFVLFSAVVSLVIYLLVDLIYFIVDPRIGH